MSGYKGLGKVDQAFGQGNVYGGNKHANHPSSSYETIISNNLRYKKLVCGHHEEGVFNATRRQRLYL